MAEVLRAKKKSQSQIAAIFVGVLAHHLKCVKWQAPIESILAEI